MSPSGWPHLHLRMDDDEAQPLLAMPTWPLPPPPPASGDDALDLSGTSIRSGTGSDALTYDAMMQLSIPRNPLRHESVRAAVLCGATAVILFLTNQLTTLPVGFYPDYAQTELGMTTVHLGLFFSLYPLCVMISSPLAAKVSPIIGRQTVICLGLVISGSTTIGFAYTDTIGMAFVLRMAQGLGAGAAVVGAFATITEEFPSNIGQVLVVQEFVVAAAFVSAPPLGSLVFESLGFQMPFIISGVAQLLAVMVVPVLFIEYSLSDGMYAGGAYRPMTKQENRDVGFADVLTPTCLLCLLVTVVTMASFGFVDPYLGSHLQSTLGLQHLAVGLGFGVSALVYFLGGLVYICLSRSCGCKQVILFGLVQLAVGFFLLGPSPLLSPLFHDYNRLWATQFVALICVGCGAALAIAPSLPLTLLSVTHMGTQGYNLVVGLFSAAVYLGQAIGPILALAFMQVLPNSHSANCFVNVSPTSNTMEHKPCDSSLPWAFTLYSLLLAVVAVVLWAKLTTGVAIVALLRTRRRVATLLHRQSSEYGQFVFFDEEDFEADPTSATLCAVDE